MWRPAAVLGVPNYDRAAAELADLDAVAAVAAEAGLTPARVYSYAETFCGRAAEAARVRREIAVYLEACPAAEDMVLIASELAANAVMHTRSRGGSFIVRCRLFPEAARIEVEDLGGPWRQRWNSGDRPHGLDIMEAQRSCLDSMT